MIDYDVLKFFKTTNERLKEICTSDAPVEESLMTEKIMSDRKILERWKKRAQNRLHEGVMWSVRNFKFWGAVDLGWDSSPINKDLYPLMLYAQNKIDFARLVNELPTDSTGAVATLPDQVKDYVKRDGSKIVGINLPKFVESSVNLIRSFVSRRVAAQTIKYNQLWPYYKYESRNTGLPGKLKADVLSQRVDVMADQYGYRQHEPQVIRDMFLYAHSVDFVRQSWEIDEHVRMKQVSPEFTPSGPVDSNSMEPYIVKEGLSWVNPHPSRVFYDAAYPLSTLNTDSGVKYIGFWDVCRYGDIRGNPKFWNRDKVTYGSGLWDAYFTYGLYFNQYMDVVTPPMSAGQTIPANLPGENDRAGTLGIYSQQMENTSAFKAEYFEKFIPLDEGVGTYPFPVWVRFVIAGDNTILYSEIMPSTPAAVATYNENENRRLNLSLAHELMPYQDIVSNLLTAARSMLEVECAKIITINTDVLKGPGEGDGKSTDANLQALRLKLQGKNWASDPTVVEYSMKVCEELKIDVTKVIQFNEPRQGQSIDTIFKAIVQFIGLVEKLNGMSPAEQGQAAPREISATETAEIASTTKAIENFISDGVDEFRAAKKRIIYESLVACSKGQIQMPVQNRYTNKTVEAAGFKVMENEDENHSDPNIKRRTVYGSPKSLLYEYNFTSRDGSDRPVNSQAAMALSQALSQILAVPQVFMAMGKEKLYSLFNEIFRLSGAGFDLNLELKEGEDDSLGQDQIQVLEATIKQIITALQQTSDELAKQQAVNMKQEGAIGHLTDLAGVVMKTAKDIDTLFTRVDKLKEMDDDLKVKIVEARSAASAQKAA